ncbi:hypothetical protein DAKH74_027210 [Maudiozyma humilis]|uniref:VPS9 domain-containing protein n=1 Tax=Maudiozyma humilis TaxID=51915 RepID=A0AAV5RXF4_MAUHU|nr:hypothetical protein DAKH74_027210 [Kazachstania humilis]
MSLNTPSTTTETGKETAATAPLTHLPLLLNPLINAIFNSSNPHSSALKKIFGKIAETDSPTFALLVPPSHLLYHYKDSHSNTRFSDLCNYDVGFVSSHVALLQENLGENGFTGNATQYKFRTLNNKEMVIDFHHRQLHVINDSSITERFKIHKADTFTSFNDYLPSRYYPVIFIDRPIMDQKNIEPVNQPSKTSSKGSAKEESAPDDNSTLKQDTTQHLKAAFQKLIKNNPRWVMYFTEHFKKFTSWVGTNKDLTLDEIAITYRKIITAAVEEMTDDGLFESLKSHLALVVSDYVEEKLYGYIWQILETRFQKAPSSNMELFYNLKYLSIDQLDTDLYSQNFGKFSLSKVIKLEKNIAEAIEIFDKFKKTNSFEGKSKILTRTLQTLSNPLDDTPIDADTLLSIFVFVINKTHTKDLECHLHFLQNIYYTSDNSNPTKYGVLGYAVSTLEAVMYFVNDNENDKFVTSKNDHEVKVRKLLSEIQDSDKSSANIDFDDYSECLGYRTATGESILSLCITNFQNHLVRNLLTAYQKEIPLEDLLDDETVDGSSLLLQAFKYGNIDAISLILDTFLENCTSYELETYLNRCDKSNRTIAHYFSNQDVHVLRIGKYINWSIKDITGKTPLFTIFRSYDQLHYSSMVTLALKMAMESHNGFVYNDHTDPNGNSLLHIIKTSVSTLLDAGFPLDVNMKNRKGMTPLMIFIKYNRTDNIKDILHDKRLSYLNRYDVKKFLTCLDYARDSESLSILVKYHIEKGTVFKHCLCHSLRIYVNATDKGSVLNASLKLSTLQKNGSIFHIPINIKVIKNIFKIVLKQHPMAYVPLEKYMTDIHSLLNTADKDWMMRNLTPLARFQNRIIMLKRLTHCMDTLIELGYVPLHIFEHDKLLLEWLKLQKKQLSEDDAVKSVSNKDSGIEPEQVTMMKHFLKFNLQELAKLRKILFTVEKLLIFRNLKNSDIHVSLDIMKHLTHDFPVSSIKRHLRAVIDVSKVDFVDDCDDISLNPTLLNLEFLDDCIKTLYKNIERVIESKILNWWKNYGEQLEIKKELMRSAQYASNNSQNSQTMNRVVSGSSSSGVFGNFLEGQRIRNDQKLVRNNHDVNSILMRLSAEITHDHEQLAEELSSFMNFRGPFISASLVTANVLDNLANLSDNSLHISKRYNRHANACKKI